MKALVIGGGIGGLTAAAALDRQGIDAVVFEAAASLAELGIGAGLTLQMNAMSALRQIGLAEAVEEAGMIGEVSEFRTDQGTLLAQWSEREIGERLGALTVHISRAALHGVLAGAVPAAAVRTGVRMVSFETDPDGVTASFDDGSTERGDVLIGADGLYSTVRSQLHGEETPRYAGYVVWRGMTTFHGDLPQGIFRMCWGRGRRFCLYQVADGVYYWFAVEDAPADLRVPAEKRKAAVLDSFRDWMAPIAEIVDSTEDGSIHLTPIYDREPTKDWGRGRATLLGDSAHPMTFNLGQGACMAIEDAVVLANNFASGAGDLEAVLRHYEQRRMDRTAAMTNRSWRIGSLGRLQNPVGCAARNLMFRLVFERFVVKGQAESMIVDLSA